MLHDILTVVQVLLCVSLVGLILIQHGKGADVGAAFGSGASGTIFGAQGSASFLTRVTAILAALFFMNSLTLGYFVGQRMEKASVMDKVPTSAPVPAPQKPSEVPSVPSPSPSDLPPVTTPANPKTGSQTPPVNTGTPALTTPATPVPVTPSSTPAPAVSVTPAPVVPTNTSTPAPAPAAPVPATPTSTPVPVNTTPAPATPNK